MSAGGWIILISFVAPIVLAVVRGLWRESEESRQERQRDLERLSKLAWAKTPSYGIADTIVTPINIPLEPPSTATTFTFEPSPYRSPVFTMTDECFETVALEGDGQIIKTVDYPVPCYDGARKLEDGWQCAYCGGVAEGRSCPNCGASRELRRRSR